MDFLVLQLLIDHVLVENDGSDNGPWLTSYVGRVRMLRFQSLHEHWEYRTMELEHD